LLHHQIDTATKSTATPLTKVCCIQVLYPGIYNQDLIVMYYNKTKYLSFRMYSEHIDFMSLSGAYTNILIPCMHAHCSLPSHTANCQITKKKKIARLMGKPAEVGPFSLGTSKTEK
jgi:hypothetical protein